MKRGFFIHFIFSCVVASNASLFAQRPNRSPIDTRGTRFEKDTLKPIQKKKKKFLRKYSMPLRKTPIGYRFYGGLAFGVGNFPFAMNGTTTLKFDYSVVGDPFPQNYTGTIDVIVYSNRYLDLSGTVELGDIKGIFGFLTAGGSPHTSLDVFR
ncbi:MAG: hypothetical protein ACKOE6_03455, partial [Flammeovirgaceae bacterium]